MGKLVCDGKCDGERAGQWMDQSGSGGSEVEFDSGDLPGDLGD